MVYIGHYTPLQVFPDNVRDDIVPAPPQVTFTLSQTVPGGYEGNVLVIRRKFRITEVLLNTDQLEFVSGVNQIICNDADTAQILSQIKVDEAIVISGATEVDNNGIFVVTNVVFDLNSITFTVASNLEDESGNFVDVRRGEDQPWEVLRPEIDYTIGGIAPNFNREITFAEVLQEEDQCYVIHRGSATYNLVPTNNSVGPNQLSHNLRNFVVDRFDGDGTETDFTLTQEPVNSKAILVTVDGQVLDGDDPMLPPFPLVGDWELVNDNILRFHVAPANTAKIRVLHLGFSTVSRRAALSDGQLGVVAPNSITSLELAVDAVEASNIANNAVTTNKIANNAVNHEKILLPNNQSLRARQVDTTPVGVLRLDNGDRTVIHNENIVSVEIDGVRQVNFKENEVEPETDNTVDLGTTARKFKNLNLAGNAVIEGNLEVTGSFNGAALPTGVIVMTASATADTGFVLCRGQDISRVTYANLFAKIGTTYGAGDGVNTFNVPNLQQRFPIGQTTTPAQPASTLGATGGNINHTHTLTHTHNVSVDGNLPNHLHSSSGLSGSHPHTHNIAHTHNVTHTHLLPRHRHTDYSLSTTSSGGGGAVSPNIFHRISGASNSPVAEPILNRTVSGSIANQGTITQTIPNHTHPIATGGRVGPASGSIEVDSVGSAVSYFNNAGNPVTSVPGDQVRSGYTTLGTTTNLTAVPVNSGQDTSGPASTPTVTISGNTGNPTTTPSISSTGNTTSQSVETTSSANPPFLVLNFQIKV